MGREARMMLRNHGDQPLEVLLEATLQTGSPAEVQVIPGSMNPMPVPAGPAGGKFTSRLIIPARESIEVLWRSAHPPIDAPGDSRQLYTALIDFRVHTEPNRKKD
jgi:hypothetical protein